MHQWGDVSSNTTWVKTWGRFGNIPAPGSGRGVRLVRWGDARKTTESIGGVGGTDVAAVVEAQPVLRGELLQHRHAGEVPPWADEEGAGLTRPMRKKYSFDPNAGVSFPDPRMMDAAITPVSISKKGMRATTIVSHLPPSSSIHFHLPPTFIFKLRTHIRSLVISRVQRFLCGTARIGPDCRTYPRGVTPASSCIRGT